MPSNIRASTDAGAVTLAWVGPAASPRVPDAFAARHFDDSDAFLLDPQVFDFDVYLVEIRQCGVSGIDLIRLIRRQGAAAIIAIDAASLPNFRGALGAGADMVVGDQADAGDLACAIAAVRRRAACAAACGPGVWRVSRTAAQLVTPGGARVPMPENDLKILGRFVESGGRPVQRGQLVALLWGDAATGMENALQATIYRLRRRIEAAGGVQPPLRSVAGTGYEFRGAIVWE